MKKTLWTLCLISLGTVAACEAPLGDDAASPTPDRGGSGDPDLTHEDGKGCSESSLNAAGCACSVGAPARACFTGSAEQAGKGACTYGMQACETTTGSEFDTSAWGQCKGSGEAATETCDNKQDDDCNGVVDDCGGDSNEGDCCADRLAECLASGASASACGTLETICSGGSCDGLLDACDPTVIPVSAQCANAYYRCFGFRVNKCMREPLAGCMATIGDAALCAAWDAACSAREDHCADLLGDFGCKDPPCDTDGGGSIYGYYCTDWGHLFDPCWDTFTKCTLEPAVCETDLNTCVFNHTGDIYSPLCGGGDDSKDPSEPGSGDPPKP